MRVFRHPTFFLKRSAIAGSLAAILAGCASGGQQPEGQGQPTQPGQTSNAPQRINSTWPIRTRSHIDLWLHGFAMVQGDTTQVPFFKRGYRERMVALKNRGSIQTSLDLNRDKLRARLAVNPDLISAQFLALHFGTWETLQRGIEIFLQAEGQPGRGGDALTQQIIATLAQVFPTALDRDWLRLFTLSLRDENEKFYRQYWAQQQRELEPVVVRLDSLWERTYLPRLQPFLNNTQQKAGDLILSLPLDGEGRTQPGEKRSNIIVVTFPESPAAALEAVYVLAHEAVFPVSSSAVNDNTTPSEKRSGSVDRYISNAAVRGGAILLRKASPDLVDGYAQYYLRAANLPFSGRDADGALAAAFPLPEAIRNALVRQLDVVLGGI